MSITYQVAATTREEFDALQSEGAPSVNMSNTNGLTLALKVLDVPDVDRDECYVSFHPEEVLDFEADVLYLARLLDVEYSPSGFDSYWTERTHQVLEVARAAQRLGRKVVAH